MKNIPVTATIPADLSLWLEEKGQRDDRTKSHVIRRILAQAWEKEKADNGEAIDLPNPQVKKS